MLALSFIGILLAYLKNRISLALLLPGVSLLAFFTVPVRFVEMRYLMPVMLVLACFAAYPTHLMLTGGRIWLQRAAAAVVFAACLLPILQGVELTRFMWRDSRYAAAGWLNAYVTPADRIGFFSVGNRLPRIRPGPRYVPVDRFFGTRQNVHYSAEDIRNMGVLLLEKNPEFVLVIPDQSAVPDLPYGLTVPPELYRKLEDGSLGYRRAARIQTPPLFPQLRRPDLVDYYEVVNPPVDIFVRNSRHLALANPLTSE